MNNMLEFVRRCTEQRRPLGNALRFLPFAALCLSMHAACSPGEPASWRLVPVSGGDGAYQLVQAGNTTLCCTSPLPGGGYASYIYLRVPAEAPRTTPRAYVTLQFRDTGVGAITLQYNAAQPQEDYRPTAHSHGAGLANTGQIRTATFELINPAFRSAQNLGADLRVVAPGSTTQLQIGEVRLQSARPAQLDTQATRDWLSPYSGPTRNDVDATTLLGKAIVGYQGWFGCPGDPLNRGWIHWSREADRLTPATLTFDMWPDVSELPKQQQYRAPGFTLADGSPACLFSSADRATVEHHFDWMAAYGLDGAEIQRFAVQLQDPADAARVLGYARAAANRTGRVFMIGYDLTGTPASSLCETIERDWKWLTDEMKITSDPRYLHHQGRPAITLFGLYPESMPPDTAGTLLDLFSHNDRYAAFVIGGVPWQWRTVPDARWQAVFARLQGVKPWNVGNFSTEAGRKYATMNYWADDLALTRQRNQLYVPSIYPGFSWDNLARSAKGSSQLPRLGGDFFWKQFYDATSLGVHSVFIAMFDEVDEGTAVFKVANDPPVQGYFVGYEGRPSDWYLRLSGEGTRMLRGERPLTRQIPLR